MEDKRKFPRFDSTFQIKYGPEGNDEQFSYTLSDDFSRGGLRMPALSGIVNKGDVVKLDINSGKWQRLIQIIHSRNTHDHRHKQQQRRHPQVYQLRLSQPGSFPHKQREAGNLHGMNEIIIFD